MSELHHPLQQKQIHWFDQAINMKCPHHYNRLAMSNDLLNNTGQRSIYKENEHPGKIGENTN